MGDTLMLSEYTKPTLIEVKAQHCVECRAMQPDLDAVAAEKRGVVDLVVLDASEEPQQVAALNVLGTPTLIAVRYGVEVARFVGRRSRTELTEVFDAVATGDVESIESTSRGDQVARTVAGAALGVVGLATGPLWILVGLGLALVVYGVMPSLKRQMSVRS